MVTSTLVGVIGRHDISIVIPIITRVSKSHDPLKKSHGRERGRVPGQVATFGSWAPGGGGFCCRPGVRTWGLTASFMSLFI